MNRITYHSVALIKRTDFLSKSRNLFISRYGGDTDHCLRSVPIVLHSKITIRSRSVFNITALDRFISRDGGPGLIDYFFGRICRQLWADWRPFKVENYLKKRILQCKSFVDRCSARSAGCGKPLVA